MATGVAATLRYWLVGHPRIAEFSWEKGEAPGATPLFVTATVLSYLYVTLILSKLTLPTINPNIFKRIKVLHSSFLLVVSVAMAAGCIVSAAASPSPVNTLFCYPPGTPPAGPAFFWAYVFYLEARRVRRHPPHHHPRRG